MLRVALVAGEVSGDTLGAGLIHAIREQHPDAIFEGVGGDAMQAAGLDAWHHSDELAVMGITEVLKHLPRLLKLRRGLKKRWRQAPPDVFVGIDAPDFNLGLEAKLKRQGIPTVHYVSPSVWAWREGRVKTIARACDRVLCLLPFEPDFYATHQVTADFVGHPLAKRIQHVDDSSVHKAALGVASERTVLAVLPGSRLGEIERLGPIFVDAIRLLKQRLPELAVVCPLANARGEARFRELLEHAGIASTVKLSVGNAAECMRAADVLLMASGTATLEGLLHGKPMVVGYQVSASTYRIVTALKLMKVDRYSLPNLLAGERVVDEFIQDEMTAENLADGVSNLLSDPGRVQQLSKTFQRIHEELAVDSDERAAAAVLMAAGAKAWQ
ncbi:MAG: lipid-A-disaccharide synthase [Pseudomonadota bacterium]